MIRRNVELQRLTTQHVGTEAMVADVMTKALSVVKFTRFRQAMKVLPIVAAPTLQLWMRLLVILLRGPVRHQQRLHRRCLRCAPELYAASTTTTSPEAEFIIKCDHDDLVPAVEIKWECELLKWLL